MKQLLWKSSGGTLGEQAYETLREEIVYLKLEPGQMIYESELAAKLGMSRTPLREAFRLLQSEELIEVKPQKGVQVALISEQKVEESRVVRESLEITAFRQVVRQWSRLDKTGKEKLSLLLNRLERLLEDQRMAEKAADPERFLQADETFHHLFLEQSMNRTLMKIVLQMRGQLNRLRLLMLRELDQMPGLTVEHEQLLQAVVRCDEPLVVRLLENHLRKLHDELPKIREKFPHYFTN